jgi:hypothetical protein
VSSGHELPLSPEVRDDEEWRKKITSLLIADRPVVIIDNVERPLRSGQLSAALTTSEWTDRILGKSEVLHLHSRAIWIATGNNIRLGGDIGRRAYWIRLNANLPRPWLRDSRTFKRELPAWAISHRAEMVAALLIMARAWFLNGKPVWSGCPLGSYETWSQYVGGILEHGGVTDFLKNLEDLYEQTDDELNEWSAFMNAIFETFGTDTSFSTKTLVNCILREAGEGNILYSQEEDSSIKTVLPDNLGDVKDKGFPRRLGISIKKHKDQIFEVEKGFVQLKEDLPDRHRHKTQWKLVCLPPNPFQRLTADMGAMVAMVAKEDFHSAPIAPIATISNGHSRDEKELISFQEGAAELSAHPARPTKEESFIFEDDPEERATIQAEAQKDGGTRDGETQTE